MSKTDLILVTGASGKTGRACITRLLERGAAVRALVRRVEAADELRRQGVRDAIVGDMFDRSIMEAAVDGVQKVLHICPPMHPQEETVGRDMIAAARSAGVDHFVLWSVLHPHIGVPHHQRKQRAEAALIDSGLTFTILQPGRYMQHLETIWPQVCAAGLHAFPFSAKTRLSIVHLDDLAEAAANVLTNPGHANAIYELAGPQALSQEDCARIISEILKREVRAEAASLDAFSAKARLAGLPDWRIETLCVMNQHYAAHGFEGNSNVLRWLLNKEPKVFSDYVRDLAAR
jgi:uncharacterized protein YbjT (DUF2867 family)